jgi:putative ABC transport system substrate-binding protein
MAFAEGDPESERRATAFRNELQKLGWIDGRNVRIDYRWSAGEKEQARAGAHGLVELQPDVLVAHATLSTIALREKTRIIPIVFTAVNEPLTQGFVDSFAHPGGNTTGFANSPITMGGKWLEILKELAPRVRRVSVVFNPAATPTAETFYRSVEETGKTLGIETTAARVHDIAEIEAVMAGLGRDAAGGLVFPPDTFMTVRRRTVIDLAAQHRVPSIYANRAFATDGGLMSYSIDAVDQFRQAAEYVDRILRGAKPAELPVQQPNKFELVINLGTAKALELPVPRNVVVRSTGLIE